MTTTLPNNGRGEASAALKLPTLATLAILISNVKRNIGDDDRASDEDTLPSVQLTIAADEKGWDWQTGDNSYSGGAYFHRNWGVATIYRDSKQFEIARELLEQIKELASY